MEISFNFPVAVAGIIVSLSSFASSPAQAQDTPPIGSVDYTFIGLTYLGNQFQVDSGKLGETHAVDAEVLKYSKLMDTSHVTVENLLVALLHRKGLVQPPASLLKASYDSLLANLSSEHGTAFEHEYVRDEVAYQKANDALYRWEIQYGSDPDLKAFARQVLPKIDDHMQQVLKLSAEGK